MSPALKAHLRLLSSLPVRTHLKKDIERPVWVGRSGRTPEVTRQLVLKYRKDGWGYTAIKNELKVSSATISNIVNGRR